MASVVSLPFISSNAWAAGVYGEATNASAQGGIFFNKANTTWAIALLATYGSGGQQIGLATNGDIQGTNSNVSIARTFTTAGTYSYTCHIHPSMQGMVVVR